MIRKIFLAGIIGLVFMGKAIGVGAVSDKTINDQAFENRDSVISVNNVSVIPANKVDVNVNISKVEAMAIATKYAKGKVINVNLQPEKGYYEIEINKFSHDVVINIDSSSGEILESCIGRSSK
ncbi:PepSY domain-containing protein [Bacillus sp. FJAT-29790]|uniref:PepSY domain-containing protein n=1 Tax=Bacillus sp. FJAT-29790 TaxID=1895002 RepID=UPI001C243742|nr:PepSY domain-containing protein [Bacillus sp. FJAT-29790]MBU8880853.1 PepSY domain-containing protein [Bacillus sp. FJAT-29790]